MRILTTVLLLVFSLCLGGVSFAAKGGNHGGGNNDHRGPSDRAYERADENAAFKRTKDWEPGVHPDKPKKKNDDADGDHKKKDKHKKKHKKDHDDDKDDDDHDQDGNLEKPLTNQTDS